MWRRTPRGDLGPHSAFRGCCAVITLHQRTTRLVEDLSRDLLQRPGVDMGDEAAVCVDEFRTPLRLVVSRPASITQTVMVIFDDINWSWSPGSCTGSGVDVTHRLWSIPM